MLQSLTTASHVFPNRLAKDMNRQYGLIFVQGFAEKVNGDDSSNDSDDDDDDGVFGDQGKYEPYQAQAYATYTTIVPLSALEYVPSLKGSGADQRVLSTVVWPVPSRWFSDNTWSSDLDGLDRWLDKVTENLVALANSKEDYFDKIAARHDISDAVKTTVAMQLFCQPNELGGPVATATLE